MKTERETSINVKESSDTKVVTVETTSFDIRKTLGFSLKDASRERDNQMYVELGKAGLAGSAFVGVALQGIDEIIKGFNTTDVNQMGRGAELVLLSSIILPITARFIHEAKVARWEKKAVDKKRKSS